MREIRGIFRLAMQGDAGLRGSGRGRGGGERKKEPRRNRAVKRKKHECVETHSRDPSREEKGALTSPAVLSRFNDGMPVGIVITSAPASDRPDFASDATTQLGINKAEPAFFAPLQNDIVRQVIKFLRVDDRKPLNCSGCRRARRFAHRWAPASHVPLTPSTNSSVASPCWRRAAQNSIALLVKSLGWSPVEQSKFAAFA